MIGIIVQNWLICWRSVAERAISCPVWARSWYWKSSRWRLAEHGLAQVGLDRVGDLEGEVAAEPRAGRREWRRAPGCPRRRRGAGPGATRSGCPCRWPPRSGPGRRPGSPLQSMPAPTPAKTARRWRRIVRVSSLQPADRPGPVCLLFVPAPTADSDRSTRRERRECPGLTAILRSPTMGPSEEVVAADLGVRPQALRRGPGRRGTYRAGRWPSSGPDASGPTGCGSSSPRSPGSAPAPPLAASPSRGWTRPGPISPTRCSGPGSGSAPRWWRGLGAGGPEAVFGAVDALKLRSSMTLFQAPTPRRRCSESSSAGGSLAGAEPATERLRL